MSRLKRTPVVYQLSNIMRAISLTSVVFLVLATLSAGKSIGKDTACADRVSSGDQSVGISAVNDPSCSSGGLGCFPSGSQCRFCRVSDTSQADHLTLCSDIKISSSSASGSKPSASGSKTNEETIDCLSLVSVGDQAVGISAVAATSPTCTANLLGCFHSGQCRFCQSRATTQSAPYLKCSDVGGSSTGSTSSTPAPEASEASTSTICSSVVSRSGLTGISYVSESRCNVASPTLLGCSPRTSCRLCRNYKNEANQYLISCQVLKGEGETESATATSDSESSGSGSSNSGPMLKAAAFASSVDNAGENADSLTVSTETNSTTATSAASSSTGPIAAAAAVVAVLVVVMMSVMYVKGNRDHLDEPSTPEDYPEGDLLTPHGSHGYTPREGSLCMVTSCASRVSIGDQNVGISAIEDASCRNGGVGCFPDGICRYCQTFASPQSNNFVPCSSVGTNTQPPASTSTPPTAVPTATTPVPAVTDCATIAKRSSFTGISFVTDTACNVARPTAMGCTALTNCRLCRTTKNENNQFLNNCAVLQNTVRRLETTNDNEDSEPKHFRNITGIALSCVGGMALVVAIIGLAHSKFCRRDNIPES
ncbi:Sporangia induced hypothetical protein [Phytophthora megakarya]|uniref:Uncharacterized protein n=1 Tax=Phytophthora megakarya TaxID=4795 RepID=A0A225VMS9_9STRA|nr:Sporangia induced hypothetical protein [Phytophthora megakarya]